MMEAKEKRIRAVAFDYGGVLAHFIDKESIAKMAEAAAVDHALFDGAMWKFRQELDSGESDIITYWSAVLDHCNSPLARKPTIETLNEMDLKGFSRMNTQMIAWAKTLKVRGFFTLIISNMAEPTYQRLLAGQAWMQHFDSAVISGIIGINKPDQRIFEHAKKQLDLDAGQILFLDDLPHNVSGARRAGLHALLFSTTQRLSEELALSYPQLPLDGLDS